MKHRLSPSTIDEREHLDARVRPFECGLRTDRKALVLNQLFAVDRQLEDLIARQHAHFPSRTSRIHLLHDHNVGAQAERRAESVFARPLLQAPSGQRLIVRSRYYPRAVLGRSDRSDLSGMTGEYPGAFGAGWAQIEKA